MSPIDVGGKAGDKDASCWETAPCSALGFQLTVLDDGLGQQDDDWHFVVERERIERRLRVDIE